MKRETIIGKQLDSEFRWIKILLKKNHLPLIEPDTKIEASLFCSRGVFDMVPIKKAIIRLGKAMLSAVLASMGTPPARGRSCTPLLESEERVRIGEKPKKLRSHTLNRVTRLAMKTGRR